jgi:hypothetical protein
MTSTMLDRLSPCVTVQTVRTVRKYTLAKASAVGGNPKATVQRPSGTGKTGVRNPSSDEPPNTPAGLARGSQINRDVWCGGPCPRHVRPRSNISAEVGRAYGPCAARDVAQFSIGTPACLFHRGGVANSHEGPFSFHQAPTRA